MPEAKRFVEVLIDPLYKYSIDEVSKFWEVDKGSFKERHTNLDESKYKIKPNSTTITVFIYKGAGGWYHEFQKVVSGNMATATQTARLDCNAILSKLKKIYTAFKPVIEEYKRGQKGLEFINSMVPKAVSIGKTVGLNADMSKNIMETGAYFLILDYMKNLFASKGYKVVR